jgi:cysteine protease ATG4
MNNEIGKLWRRTRDAFWDTEPQNNPADGAIWCLGARYDPYPNKKRRASSTADTDASFVSVSQESDTSTAPTSVASIPHDDPDLKEYDQITPAMNSLPAAAQPPSSPVSQPQPPQTDSTPQAEPTVSDAPADEDGNWPTPFLDDFESRIWMTYRNAFPPIPRSQDPKASAAITFRVKTMNIFERDGFTSDTGWGCMIRSGQSLLANAILLLRLGRDWRRGQKPDEEKQIVSLFADDPQAPFSIHRFVEHGATACGKHPGEWFGPSATTRCIQALTNSYRDAGMKVYSTDDGSEVYEDKFMEVARSGSADFTPTLILVGTRLGIQGVTPAYHEALKASLQMPQSIGIAG